MRSGGDPDSLGKPYAEAFPHLDVHEVQRASAVSDSPFYEWEDEDGLILGHIEVGDLTSQQFPFRYRFLGTRNIEAGSGAITIVLTWRKTGAHWLKPNFQCPGCGRDVSKIFYARGMWRCKSCHGLLNLAQRLSPVNKALWQRDELYEKMKIEPKTAAERRKHEKDKRVYGAAVRLLADVSHRGALPDAFSCRAYGRWLTAGELPRVTVKPDEIGYGWQPGDSGQFSGLDTRPRPARRHAAPAASTALQGASEAQAGRDDALPGEDDLRPGEESLGWFAKERARKRAEARAKHATTGKSDSDTVPRVAPWFG